MLLAVAVVALAPGAVAELQLGVGNICPSADGAAVGVGGFGGSFCCLVGTGIELDDLCLLLLDRLLFEEPPGIEPPGQRQYVAYIGTKKQEIVGKGNYREIIIGGPCGLTCSILPAWC